MTSGLPGEGRLLRWMHGHAYETRFQPRFRQLESIVPYGGAALVYCLLVLLAARREDDRGPAVRAMAAGVVAWLVSDVLKLLVERPRPCLDMVGCGHHSFPEGPGMVFAAIAVAIWPRSRAIAAVAVACALADAAVQLGYGSHWPSDMAGAWLLGGLCGFAVPRLIRPVVRRDDPPAPGE